MAEYAFKIWIETEEGIARSMEILEEVLAKTSLTLIETEFDWA